MKAKRNRITTRFPRIRNRSARIGVQSILSRIDQPRRDEPRALRAGELTEDQIDRMLSQPIPEELERFDDEVPEGWLERT